MYIIDILNTVSTDFSNTIVFLIIVLFSLVGEFNSLKKPMTQYSTNISFNIYICHT